MTTDKLKSILTYNPCTGEFKWRYGRKGRRSRPGTITNRRYLVIFIEGKFYQAHRLAWLYTQGEWPHGEIDHLDCNPMNNSIFNLADVSHRDNMSNQRRHKGSPRCQVSKTF